jgi:hypothetical protein
LKKYEKGQQQKSIKPELNDLNGKQNRMLCSFELMHYIKEGLFYSKRQIWIEMFNKIL